jgi:hypothetical protein
LNRPGLVEPGRTGYIRSTGPGTDSFSKGPIHSPTACSPRQLRTPSDSTFSEPSRSSIWNICQCVAASAATRLRWGATDPAPVQGLDGQLEHYMEAILKFSVCAGRPHVRLVLWTRQNVWTGLDASGDTWEPLKNLTKCDDASRAFEQARELVLPRAPPPPPSQACCGVAPPWALCRVSFRGPEPW